MKVSKYLIVLVTCLEIGLHLPAQNTTAEAQLAKIKNIGYQQSQAKDMLYQLTDVYG